MASRTTDSAFVVVTGDPQRGNGERISQVRSHLAKQYHQNSRQKKSRVSETRKKQAYIRRSYTSQSLPREIHLTLDPSQLFASATGFQRMQRFMYHYVYDSYRLHPFFSTVVYAAVAHAPLMSSKILNASAWDDLNSTGEISDLSLQQRVITRNLLGESLGNPNEGYSDLNIAALIACILFDLVSDDKIAFSRDKQGLQNIVQCRGGSDHLGFEGHLKNSLLLIKELERVAGIDWHPESMLSSIQTTQCQPLDMRFFAFGREQDSIFISETLQSFIHLLSDFYQLVILCQQSFYHPPNSAARRHCVAQSKIIHKQLSSTRSSICDNTHSPDDPRIAPLALAGILFSWSTVASREASSHEVAHATLELRNLLQQTDLDKFWGLFPGALVWCLVTGSRMSSPGPVRKWFVMQTTRITCSMAMSCCDDVLQSLQTILGGLNAAKLLRNGVLI
ncbi:hypothetical protein NUU61_000855 [Penicillium alfredii]|uniref:Transcription factor domain-containing protein n=1 Tax=Penicillium alfredii TaxID=1506179 RepID=A0A9W9KRF0_9EURO|nr:uncharacterized protein NUU61_000855 [Penicillium alfredii]KAJ5115096.1 hypothetical protein NUU61_000855 [Penicillium alfredii]